MGVAASNVAGGAATQVDPAAGKVSEAVLPQGQAPAPVAVAVAPVAEAPAAAKAARDAAIAAQDAAAAAVTQEGLNPGAAAQEGPSWAVQNAQEMRDRAMADAEAANRRDRLADQAVGQPNHQAAQQAAVAPGDADLRDMYAKTAAENARDKALADNAAAQRRNEQQAASKMQVAPSNADGSAYYGQAAELPQ